MSQDDLFLKSEGNKWFERNKDSLSKKSVDLVMDLISEAKSLKSDSKVLEIGCSNGYRLNSIQKIYHNHCYGLDASEDAIKNGTNEFKTVELNQGAADCLPYENEKFDMIIINFVLHWIDRKRLLKVVSEIDRVLKEDGQLIIGDFYPNTTQKTLYHHVIEPKVYTYKQNYFELFKATNLYSLLELWTFDHRDMRKSINSEFQHRCSLALLKKEGSKLYVG